MADFLLKGGQFNTAAAVLREKYDARMCKLWESPGEAIAAVLSDVLGAGVGVGHANAVCACAGPFTGSGTARCCFHTPLTCAEEDSEGPGLVSRSHSS